MSPPIYWLTGLVGLHWALSICFSAHSNIWGPEIIVCMYVCMCKTVHTVDVNAYRTAHWCCSTMYLQWNPYNMDTLCNKESVCPPPLPHPCPTLLLPAPPPAAFLSQKCTRGLQPSSGMANQSTSMREGQTMLTPLSNYKLVNLITLAPPPPGMTSV